MKNNILEDEIHKICPLGAKQEIYQLIEEVACEFYNWVTERGWIVDEVQEGGWDTKQTFFYFINNIYKK